jgi:hypothetical protein
VIILYLVQNGGQAAPLEGEEIRPSRSGISFANAEPPKFRDREDRGSARRWASGRSSIPAIDR